MTAATAAGHRLTTALGARVTDADAEQIGAALSEPLLKVFTDGARLALARLQAARRLGHEDQLLGRDRSANARLIGGAVAAFYLEGRRTPRPRWNTGTVPA